MISTPIQSTTNTSTINSIVLTLLNPPTDGNTLVLGFGTQTGNSIQSISQSGAIWKQATVSSSFGEGELWYTPHMASGSTTITITLNKVSDSVASVSEFSGLVTPYLDQTAYNFGVTGNPDTGTTPTTNHPNELWYGFLAQFPGGTNTFLNPTNGFTGINTITSGDGNILGGSFYKIVSSEGRADVSATVGPAPPPPDYSGNIFNMYRPSSGLEVLLTSNSGGERTTSVTPSFSSVSGSLSGGGASEYFVAMNGVNLYTWNATTKVLYQYTMSIVSGNISLVQNWSSSAINTSTGLAAVVWTNSTDIYLMHYDPPGSGDAKIARISASNGSLVWDTSLTGTSGLNFFSSTALLSGNNLTFLQANPAVTAGTFHQYNITINNGSFTSSTYSLSSFSPDGYVTSTLTYRTSTELYCFGVWVDSSAGTTNFDHPHNGGLLHISAIIANSGGISNTDTTLSAPNGIAWIGSNLLSPYGSKLIAFSSENEFNDGWITVHANDTNAALNVMTAANLRGHARTYSFTGPVLTLTGSLDSGTGGTVNPVAGLDTILSNGGSTTIIGGKAILLVSDVNNHLTAFDLTGNTQQWQNVAATYSSSNISWVSQDYIAIIGAGHTRILNVSDGSLNINVAGTYTSITDTGLAFIGSPSSANLYGTV